MSRWRFWRGDGGAMNRTPALTLLLATLIPGLAIAAIVRSGSQEQGPVAGATYAGEVRQGIEQPYFFACADPPVDVREGADLAYASASLATVLVPQTFGTSLWFVRFRGIRREAAPGSAGFGFDGLRVGYVVYEWLEISATEDLCPR